VPGAFASRLAQDRDTPSCRATAATVRPASKAPAMMYRFAIRFAVQAWWPAAPAGARNARREGQNERVFDAGASKQ